MFRIKKVTGDSMSPDYHQGDFVILLTLPFFIRRLKIGDVIAFEHQLYGSLIKRIASFDPETSQVFVEGTHPDSLDSRRLGSIDPGRIRGKVIAHIPRSA